MDTQLDNSFSSRFLSNADKKSYIGAYLSQPEIIKQIILRYYIYAPSQEWRCNKHDSFAMDKRCNVNVSGKIDTCDFSMQCASSASLKKFVTSEVTNNCRVRKTKDMDSKTIGFIDAIVSARFTVEITGRMRRDEYSNWIDKVYDHSTWANLAIECAIEHQPISNVVKKILSLQRYHFSRSNPTWFYVTTFDINVLDLAQLKDHNIRWIKLGPGFEEWLDNELKVKAEPIMVL